MDLAFFDQTLFAISYRQYGLALLAVLVALAVAEVLLPSVTDILKT
jgi:hypothetical protein